MSTKTNKLTPANIRALHDIDAEADGVQIAETYAVFPQDAAGALKWLQDKMAELDNRTGHPYASLHAVVRKLSAQVVSEAGSRAKGESEEDTFRPQPGEYFQVWKGFGHDDTTFRVIEYAPMTAAPERIMSLYDLPVLPTEAVHAWRLEKVPTGRGKETRWAGVAFTAFPVEIMVPPGHVKQRPGLDETVVVALTPAQIEDRKREIDGEFNLKLGDLLEEYDVDDALSLPRDVWHELDRWRSNQYALAHGRDPSTREYVAGAGPARPRRQPGTGSRPSSGACEHCGLPTKGGRFTPGHDAKLKGDLGRQAQSTDAAIRIPALAESAVRSRDSSKWMIKPLDEDAAAVDELLLDEAPFLAERNAARVNVHKEAS